MRRILFTLLLSALLLPPAAARAGVAGLEKSLGTTRIENAQSAAMTEEAVRQIFVATDQAIRKIFEKGALSQADLVKIDAILKAGVEAADQLRRAGGTTPADPPATPPATGSGPADSAAGTTATGTAGETVESGTVSVDTRLNIRDGVWGNIIGKLGNGDKVEIVGQEGDWYKIRHDGGIAYVHSRYVNKGGATPPGAPGAPSGEAFRGYVKTNGGGLNVRSAPWGAIIGQLNAGSRVEVLGREGEWCVIQYDGNRAYVHSDYVARGDAPPADQPPVVDTTPGPDGFTFPVGVAGCSFADTWGAARSGGRRHEGTDIFNRRNSPLVACRDGQMGSTSSNSLGGRCVRVIGAGVSHYYAHLERIADVRPGQSIRAGTVVGYMGNSGNAASTPCHLHFGMYRNNAAFNPYPILHSSYRHGRH